MRWLQSQTMDSMVMSEQLQRTATTTTPAASHVTDDVADLERAVVVVLLLCGDRVSTARSSSCCWSSASSESPATWSCWRCSVETTHQGKHQSVDAGRRVGGVQPARRPPGVDRVHRCSGSRRLQRPTSDTAAIWPPAFRFCPPVCRCCDESGTSGSGRRLQHVSGCGAVHRLHRATTLPRRRRLRLQALSGQQKLPSSRRKTIVAIVIMMYI